MKPVRVITVNGLHGAGANDIGALVAQQLGWNFLDKQLVEQIAGKAQVKPEVLERYDEHVDPWFSRLLKSLWRSGYESASAESGTAVLDCESTLELTRRTLLEAANIGNCVIVGRGGQFILGDRDDAFHIFLHAPLGHRRRRIARANGDEQAAAQQIERIDRERSGYIRRFFDADWCDPAHYDLMLATTMSNEAAAGVITCAVKGRSGK